MPDGGWGGGGSDIFVRAHAVMARGEIPFAELVDPILPLERVADGFNALHSGYKLEGRDGQTIAEFRGHSKSLGDERSGEESR